MTPYMEPIVVGLNATQAYGKTAWGLASTGNDFLGEVMADGASLGDAFFAAFTALVQRPEFQNRPIDLHCASADLSRTLAEFTAFPHITVHPWTETTSKGLLVRTAHKAAFNAIQTLHPQGRVTLPGTETDTGDIAETIVAATDGSTGYRGDKGTKAISGWGWITNTGTHGSGHVATGSILAAELHAIRSLLESTRWKARLIVLCDSKDAIEIVTALQAGAAPTSFTFQGASKMLSTLRHLRLLLADRDVTFDWVRGHSGHALNEGADRLAVQARRAQQGNIASSVHEHVAQQIVTETMTALPSLVAQAA